jgi:DNA-binding CsgD family transcriptional regulator
VGGSGISPSSVGRPHPAELGRDAYGDGLRERERELAALGEALAAARSGTGGLVFIEGPAGIGRSRLLSAARSIAEARGMTVLTARGIDLDRDASFGIASDLFAPVVAGTAPTNANTAARLLTGQAVHAAPLFDPAAAARPADPSALARGLYWLTVNVAAAAGHALLIGVDDAQWADRPSLAYLAHLAARIGEIPVLLVLAVRSDEQATDRQVIDFLRASAGAGRYLLTPEPLSAGAVAAMVAAELPGAEPAFTCACAEVSAGNPFLVTELLRALIANHIPPTAASVAQVRDLLPGSVLRSVLIRLARLGEPAEKLAKAVAVLGSRAMLRHARRLAGIDAVSAEEAADALAGARILAPGEPLTFTHPLIAASVYADIPAFARARAHREAADLLAADGASMAASLDDVAAQLLLTSPDGDQPTVAILRQAATRTLIRGDPAAAARFLRRALAEPPAPSDRGHVLLELANAEIERGNLAAGELIAEAVTLAGDQGDPEGQVAALAALGRLRFNRNEHEAAAQAMEKALELLGPDDPALPGLLAGFLMATTFRAGLHSFAVQRLRPMLKAARDGNPPGDPRLLAHLVLRLAFAAEPADRIRRLAAQAVAADPLIDPASLGMLGGIVVQALACVDELDEAERISGAALAAAARRGSVPSFSVASFHRAIGRYHRGELAGAMADLEQSLIATREGWHAGDAWLGSLLAQVHLERGDLAAARDALAMTAAAEPGMLDLPVALFARSRVALADDRPADALAHAEEAGNLLADGFGIDHPGFLPWQRTAALAARALGDVTRARAHADQLTERARWAGTARAAGLALRTQAAVRDPDQRWTLLAEAAEVLSASQSALERAHVLVELGAAARHASSGAGAGAVADSRRAAEPPLRQGLDLANRMGAGPLAEAARAELRALGLRPRRPAATGADSLTPAERRVAELIASGMSNRQAAEALFITVKTVETHLAHVYQKLAITARAELATTFPRP